MILTILGARPQFVKAAALSKSLAAHNVSERIIHTGQHYDHNMSDVFFEELGIPGVYRNLEIGSGGHGQQTGEMLIEIEKEILDIGDELTSLLVFGDTNSTIAGAIAASKLHIPIVHVEAGLRSYNRRMPEEVNRVVTDHLSKLLFCSSEVGVKNLENEGITRGVFNVGDIMQDSINTFLPLAKQPQDDAIRNITSGRFNLMTIHRPANTDSKDKLQEILNGLGQTKTPIIWPVHPRNNEKLKVLTIPSNITLTKPLSYFEMMFCLDRAQQVYTDSGGLQKEAYWLKTPCITLRPETEWIETLHNNWNQLCDGTITEILSCSNALPDKDTWKPLYGDGTAGNQIAQILLDNL